MIQNSGYLSELHDELLKDALVFGVDSDIVRKKCIADGNDLILQKAREIAGTDEPTRLQLQAMTIEADTTQVNSLQRAKGNEKTKQRGQRDKENKETTSNYATDAAMSPIQAVLNATIATVISAKFARKGSRYTKYRTIQPVNNRYR